MSNVEIQWDFDKDIKRCRFESFCYGPKSCRNYKMSRARSVPYKNRDSALDDGWLDDICTEGMFLVGPEPLYSIDDFISGLNVYLSDKTGNLELRLIKETLPYIKKDKLQLARELAGTHPAVYRELCKEALATGNYDELIRIGEDAMGSVSDKLLICSEIAYITGEAYRFKNRIDNYRDCLVKGFCSNSTPANFIALFTVCDLPMIYAVYSKKTVEILQAGTFIRSVSKELEINKITARDDCIIRLFKGEYLECKKKLQSDRGFLGWSDSLKGLGVYVFLILLEKGNKPSKAKNNVYAFVKSRIRTETEHVFVPGFDESIAAWKQKMSMKTDKEELLLWLRNEVDKRVEALVGGGYRRSYYKGAELIVYLGQVLESNGEEGVVTELVDKYTKLYSRKRVFRAELGKMLMD